MISRRARSAFLVLLALDGCRPSEGPRELSSRPEVVAPLTKTSAPAPTAAPPASSGPSPAKRDAENTRAFAETVAALSEPDAPFFSDNFISNEASYVDVAARLGELATQGGAYIGVGPEQNFTYIATTRPSVAFIIDIRRQNMLLHLLYKAIFDTVTSRSHFLAALTGRTYDPDSAPSDAASITEVVAYADHLPASERAFADLHAALVRRIEEGYGIHLDAGDEIALEKTHRAFFTKSLDLRFELKKANGRRYPTLRELVSAKDAGGRELGFLEQEDRFRFVQDLQRKNRVIPVVGDVAGQRAMPGIAAYLAKTGVTVSAFYISNVEQYLFEPGVWAKWSNNVAALPSDEHSLFIRAYLDQGKAHPQQRKGQRSATLLQRIGDFEAHNAKHAYPSFWAVATDDVVH